LTRDFEEANTAVANAGFCIPRPIDFAAAPDQEVTSSCDPGANWLPLSYLLAEFPTTWRSEARVSSTINDSLAKYFLSLVPAEAQIERVYWTFEGVILRIWIIMDHPDYKAEVPIYDAELRFMDRFPELEFDFSIIYRFGKAIEQIAPTDANLAFR
jgi:hypothetical protein